MNIGFITPWFNRGLGHVSRHVADILAQEGHKIFILATNRLINNQLPEAWKKHDVTMEQNPNAALAQ